MSAHRTIDRVVGWLGWLVAAASFIALPGMLYAFFRLAVDAVGADASRLAPFAIATVASACAIALLARSRTLPDAVVTFEHELTHALLAWLTLHRVRNVGKTLRAGGRVSYQGRGNWLIALGPALLPPGIIAAMIAARHAGAGHRTTWSVVLGVLAGYYLAANWSPRFRHYSDTREAGVLLRFFFLPVAIAFFAGLLVSFVAGRPLTEFLEHVVAPTRAFITLLMAL